jgi:hypothetical protein
LDFLLACLLSWAMKNPALKWKMKNRQRMHRWRGITGKVPKMFIWGKTLRSCPLQEGSGGRN